MGRVGVMKDNDDAQGAFGGENYRAMPKSVLAMIAFSFAQRIVGDAPNRDAVLAEIAREWDALHANGLVPQKPARLETLSQEADRIEGYSATKREDALGESNRAKVAWLREQAAAAGEG